MKPSIIDSRKARLYAALAARDMTVEQLADLARVDRARIHRWHSPRPVAPRPTKGEKRGGPPSAITTEAIATALGVPPAALEVGGPWGPLVGEVDEPERYLRPSDEGRAAAECLVDEVLTLPPVLPVYSEGVVGGVAWRVMRAGERWVGAAGGVVIPWSTCRREEVRGVARVAAELAGLGALDFVRQVLPTLDLRCAPDCPMCDDAARYLRQFDAPSDETPDQVADRTLAMLRGEEGKG